jgi:signal transduction histidine kinase
VNYLASDVEIGVYQVGAYGAGQMTMPEPTDQRLVQPHQDKLREACDLAEQRAAELEAVIESVPDGVYIATPDGKVRSNHQARRMSGDNFPSEIKTLERALAGESTTEIVRTPDHWIRSVASPIRQGNKIVGGIAVNTDVTEMRMRDEALRKSEKLAAVGQLASSIAHEINNPLESITNLLYLMRQSQSMDEVQEYARIAQDELARVTEITLQTLRFHRQQSKPSEVNVADLLNTVMALYTGRLLVRDVDIEMKLTESPPVLCLEGEIRQVINNLVRNALDAMSTGGRLLMRLHPQPDWVDGRNGVRVTVADTGEGIAPEIMAHLFEPFQTTKELTGTGLGLWVSKGIVEKHGGFIRTKTRRGNRHGTIFAIWLPLNGGINLVAGVN